MTGNNYGNSAVDDIVIPEAKQRRPKGADRKEWLREMGRKGGLRSQQLRKERLKMRAILIELLLMPSEYMDGTKMEEICVQVFRKAQQGDLKAFELIRDTIGEKPSDKLQVEKVFPKLILFGEDENKAEVLPIEDATSQA